MKSQCVICKLSEDEVENAFSGDAYNVNCPRCGRYKISGTAFALAQNAPEDLKFSAWLRSRQRLDDVAVVASGTAREIKSGIPAYSVGEKQTLLLKALADQSKHPGKAVDVVMRFDFVLAWASGEEEMGYLMDALRDRELLSIGDVQSATDAFYHEATITPKGWDYLDTVARTPALSHQGFVAMSFADDMKSAWTDGIEPAVTKAGYSAYRVDVAKHTDRIDAKIVAEIRASKFLVADVTGQRAGVYFEAGYALGRDLPVFWCVREDELSKVHFDTRQYRHIVWKTEADLAEQLEDLIVAVLGRGPAKVK